MNCEMINASKYYGSHATGWVVVVDGLPHHFTGSDAKVDAETFRAIFIKGDAIYTALGSAGGIKL